MRTLYTKWRYLGLDGQTYRQSRHALDVHNVTLLKQVSGVCAAAAGVAMLTMLFIAEGQRSRALMLGALCILMLVLYACARSMTKRPDDIGIGKTFALTFSLELLLYLGTLYLGTVASEGDLAVAFVWTLLFMQIVFDLPVRQNLLTLLPMYALFLLGSWLYKTKTIFIFDTLHATLSLLIGLFCSYKKTQEKLHNIIYEKQLREVNYALYHTSTTDELTGMPNRRRIFEQMRAMALDCPPDKRLACVVMDIDDFKGYNDIYGHPAGDDVLRGVGAALDAFAKQHDMRIGRIGGEEFLAVWLTDDPPYARQLAEALRRTICGLGIPHSRMPGGMLTASAGVSCVPPERVEDAYSLADRAVYRAKDDGKDRTRCLDLEPPTRTDQR